MEQQVYGKWRCDKCKGIIFVNMAFPAVVREAKSLGLIGKWEHEQCGGFWQHEEPIDEDKKSTMEKSNENQG